MRRADLDSLRGECGQRDRGQAHEQEAADALEQGNGATLPRRAHRGSERHARRRLPQALSRLPPCERRRCNRSRRVMNPTALHTPVEEETPGRHLYTDDQLKHHIEDNAWGHHACGTCTEGTPRIRTGLSTVTSVYTVSATSVLSTLQSSPAFRAIS